MTIQAAYEDIQRNSRTHLGTMGHDKLCDHIPYCIPSIHDYLSFPEPKEHRIFIRIVKDLDDRLASLVGCPVKIKGREIL